jgi:hypothetical protein
MNRLFAFALLFGLWTSCKAQVGRIAEVEIIDRDTGAVLSPHYYRGEYWVAGTPGARYAIEIRNRLGERLLAVTSVDGVNVISGATAGFDQTGYVFSPGERYQITGWRKSDAEIAAFTFTDSSNSYAERTGRPANVGVIGLAIFRERQPQPIYTPPTIGQSPAEPDPRRFDEEARRAESAGRLMAGQASRSDQASRSESMAKAQGGSGSDAASTVRPAAQPAPATAPMANLSVPMPAPAPKLGTGHGEREYSYVNHTEFLRMQTQPNEVIRIHYDSMDNLLAMGIIKRPRLINPTPNPFPASPEQQYVPDPRG